MKLQDLLKRITKWSLLPLKVNTADFKSWDKSVKINDASGCFVGAIDNDDVPTGQGMALSKYMVHAANVLPELVEAARLARNSIFEHMDVAHRCGFPFGVTLDALDAALARAEEVKE